MRPGSVPFRRAAVVVGGLALVACQREAAPEPTPAPAAPAARPAPPAMPPAPPVLGRAEVLEAVDAAASAQAAGSATASDSLVGRRFVLRQAFGCQGPSRENDSSVAGLPAWSWRGDGKAIELRLSPAEWLDSPLIGGPGVWEAVEGFWLSRPWMRAEGCPASGSPGTKPLPAPSTPAEQTVGLAAVFKAGGSRLARRMGRDYVFTVRGQDGEPPPVPVGGYRLVIEGRFAGFPDGGAIRCRASSPDHRPVCIVAAEVDRVAFENAGGEVLGEWRPG